MQFKSTTTIMLRTGLRIKVNILVSPTANLIQWFQLSDEFESTSSSLPNSATLHNPQKKENRKSPLIKESYQRN